MISYLYPVILAFFVGALAQKTGLCMVRGVQELLAKRPGFLATILCCGFWIWLIPFSQYNESISMTLSRYAANIPVAIGGLLFGLGAALNKGCSISTISKLSKGHIYMFATVLGWICGWCFLASMSFAIEYKHLSPVMDPSMTVTVLLFVLIALIFFRIPPQRRPILLGILLFGVIASILTYQLPEWSPSQLLKDITAAGVHGESEKWPSFQRYLTIVGLITGMAISAKERLSLKSYELRPKQLISHLFAGIIMGIGASLALGGNDSQLLVALPSFSPAGAIAIFSMIIGIIGGIFLRRVISHRKEKNVLR